MLLAHVETNTQTDAELKSWKKQVRGWDWKAAIAAADAEKEEKRKARWREKKEAEARNQLGKDADNWYGLAIRKLGDQADPAELWAEALLMSASTLEGSPQAAAGGKVRATARRV